MTKLRQSQRKAKEQAKRKKQQAHSLVHKKQVIKAVLQSLPNDSVFNVPTTKIEPLPNTYDRHEQLLAMSRYGLSYDELNDFFSSDDKVNECYQGFKSMLPYMNGRVGLRFKNNPETGEKELSFVGGIESSF